MSAGSGPAAGAGPRSPYELLGARQDRSRPFITGYDGPDSCTELSVLTTMNAIAKAAGLLRDELGLPPGARCSVDLPVHWQLPVWTLAGLSTGLVVGMRDAGDVDVRILGPAGLLALGEGADPRADEVLGCACDAFGMPVPGGVPGGVIDVGVAVRAHPDVFAPEPGAMGQAGLLVPDDTGEPVLTPWAVLLDPASGEAGARTWVTSADLEAAGLPEALLLRRAATDPVVRGGSVVLAHDVSAADADRLRLAQGAQLPRA